MSSSSAALMNPLPTSNTLPASQRIRLRKSSRKLEAVLGATPFVLETNLKDVSSHPRPPPTPRTKARRRRGWLIPQKPVVPSDSESDDETVLDIVLTQSDDKTDEAYEQLMDQPTLPKEPTARRARGKSDATDKPRFNKSKPLPKTPLPHTGHGFPIVGRVVRHKKSFTRPLAQPLFVPAGHRESIISVTSITSDKQSSSPLSPSFGYFQAPNHKNEAREREARRRKLAKLNRTLGENVPPELVFPTSAPRERRFSFLRSKGSPIMKPLSHVNAPSMSTFAPAHATPSLATTPPKKFQRAHRPRSLSVPTLSMDPSNVEIIVTNDDGEEEAIQEVDEPPSPVVIPFPSPASTRRSPLQQHANSYPRRPMTDFLDSPKGRVAFEGLMTMRTSLDEPQPASAISNDTIADSLCRRKEREWSGEWNLKDMDSVKKRLRQLKKR